MKFKIAIILCAGLVQASIVSANYTQMNKTLKNYTPPQYYFNALEHEIIKQDTLGDDPFFNDKEQLDATRQTGINALKLGYEKKLKNQYQGFFLSDIEESKFRHLADISSTPQRLIQLVGESLRLEELEIIAGLRNPAVLAAQDKIQAELASFDQVMNLDDMLKQYSAFTEGINTKAGPLKMKTSIKQKFPFPGLSAIKGRIIDQQVAKLMEARQIAQKNIITQTRKVYWDMVFIDQSIRITKETINAFDRLKDVATTLYKSGKTSFQDVIKVNIKIEVLKEDLITLASKKKNIQAKLRELINLPTDTPLGNVFITSPNQNISVPEKLYKLAQENRQELKSLRHQIEKVQNMIEMAESMIYEPFTLNLSAYEDEAINKVGTGAKKTAFPEKTMASMKNKSPLKPWYGIDEPWLRQTKQTLLSLQQTLVKQENATNTMVREAWFKADKNKRELALYKSRILSLSKSALDVSTREYAAGSIPFSQAIDSYTSWLKIKLNIVKKQTELGISTANLEKIIGTRF